MPRVDPTFINKMMSKEALRQKLIDALEFKFELLAALKDAPVLPPAWLLKELDQGSKWPEDKIAGKLLQREHGLDAVPPVTECENGAGLWQRIRRGLLS